MDFVSDAVFDGRRFRALTVVDAFTRECLAIEVDQALRADAVVATLERLAYLRGIVPGKIRVDNGPEFISRVLDHWAYRHGVTLDFSRPGEPTDNAFVGIVQSPAARRVPEHALVLELAGRPGQDRGVAAGRQRVPSSHILGVDDAGRICPAGRG